MNEHHYFASNVFGWAVADTREEAINKLINCFHSTLKNVITNTRKSDSRFGKRNGGAILYVCRVEAPKDESYKIEWFQPKGVPISEGENLIITNLTKNYADIAPDHEVDRIKLSQV